MNMKKMKKKLLSLLIVCALTFVLAACGSSTDSSTAASASKSTEAAAVQTETVEQTEAVTEAPTEAQTVSVTFDLNYEGAPEGETQEIAYDDVAEEPAAPARDNYEFQGWFTDAECTSEADFEYSLTEDTVFYAGWKVSGVTVTFDVNYEGGESTAQTVAVGEAVGEPSAPIRDGYLFSGWYADAEGTASYDFTTAVETDTTVYAIWEQMEEGKEYFTVTFMWNYEGAPNDGVYSRIQVEKNSKIGRQSPSRGDDYYLDSSNWYTEPECINKFKFATTRITEDITLYARWYDRYTFEAENTDFEGKSGLGYSGTVSDTMLIVNDRFGAEASGNYYVTYLFYNGAFLEFHVDAAEDIENACLDVRLSTEMMSIELTDTEFLIEVNGENLSYGSLSIPLTIDGANGYSDDAKQPFSDFFITNSLSLKKGENIIRLVVNNDRQMGSSGTMYATAPMIDCIHISTDTALSWSEGYPKNTEITG
jgi:uncharacterized repeat protein (TIGR02543 family)